MIFLMPTETYNSIPKKVLISGAVCVIIEHILRIFTKTGETVMKIKNEIPGVGRDIVTTILKEEVTEKYPFTFYSGFVGFSKSVDEQPKFCSCQEAGIKRIIDERLSSENPHKLYYDLPHGTFDEMGKSGNFNIAFEDGICHECNGKKINSRHASNPISLHLTGDFGWSIKGNDKKPYESEWMGVIYLRWISMGGKIFKAIGEVEGYHYEHDYDATEEEFREFHEFVLEQYYENYAHINKNPKYGVKKIDRWKTEYGMYREILSRIKGEKIIRNARPDFLKNPKTGRNLEIDVWIPGLKIGFEYNGEYHYHEINRSAEALAYTKKKDTLKKKLFKKNGYKLVVIPYTEKKKIPEIVSEALSEIAA